MVNFPFSLHIFLVKDRIDGMICTCMGYIQRLEKSWLKSMGCIFQTEKKGNVYKISIQFQNNNSFEKIDKNKNIILIKHSKK